MRHFAIKIIIERQISFPEERKRSHSKWLLHSESEGMACVFVLVA